MRTLPQMRDLRASDDETSLGWTMQVLGLVLTAEGEYDLADEAMLDGVTIAWMVGGLQNSSFSLAFRGDIALLYVEEIR